DGGSGAMRRRPAMGISAHLTYLVGPRRQAQAAAILNHPRALAQRDGRAGPAFTRRAVGGGCNLIILDPSDGLDNNLAVRRPCIDAEGEVISRRGHRSLL